VVSVITPADEAVRGSAASPGIPRSRGPAAVTAVGIAIVLPLAATTSLDLPSWSLRWALLPTIVGAGIAALVGIATRPGPARVPARWALAWLAWAIIATLLAPNPMTALWGEYGVGTGLVFLLALGGAWAIGTRAGPQARPLIANALIIGCTANAALAVAEQLVDLRAFGVAVYEGRSAGLYGNPVYLAGLLAGGLWLTLWQLARPQSTTARGRVAVVAAAALMAAGIELSGSRAALLVAVGAAVVTARSVRGRWRVGIVAVVAAGIAAGALIGAVAPGSTTSTDRVTGVAEATDGYKPRIATWEAGISALGPRVLWGFGPNGVLAATGPRRTLTIARSEGPDTMFADAHNLAVESVVTTGVVGLALLIIWLWGAVGLAWRERRHRWGHGLLGFAGMVAAVSLLEPLHVGVTPLALLALGAAGSAALPSQDEAQPASIQSPPARERVRTALAGASTVVGLAFSAWLVVALAQLRQADVAGNPSAASSAAHRLPPVGQPDSVVGTLFGFQGISGSDANGLKAAIVWWTAAARQDPANPARWNDLAGARDANGDPVGAVAAYRRALADDPWSERALTGLVHIGARGGETGAELSAAGERLARLGPTGPANRSQ
jgi:O-antigen ligase